MKKYLLILALALFALSANAKRTQATLSTDPNLHVGKLPNGLTYYILRNNTPPNRANFYLAQCVGSLQESDNQRGLAHFLEHLCFNGTRHFPSNTLVAYLETLGLNSVKTSMPIPEWSAPCIISTTFPQRAPRP